MLLRPNDPDGTRFLIEARLETLRGRRPFPSGNRRGPRPN